MTFRIRQFVMLVALLFGSHGYLTWAEEDSEDARLALKVELLGGTVAWDDTGPTPKVVRVSFRGKTRFDARYLHVLNEFKNLQSIDLGNMPITEKVVEQIEQPPVIANLLLDGDRKQYSAVLPKFRQLGERGLDYVRAELNRQPLPGSVPSSATSRELRAKRQINAALTLLNNNQPEMIWPLLRHAPDPRVRSGLIHRLASTGMNPAVLVDRLKIEPDITVRRALLLSLGEYGGLQISEELKAALVTTLRELYTTDSDAGLHAACRWLLRQLDQEMWLRETDTAASSDNAYQRTLERAERAIAEQHESPLWYLNSQGQTMVVIPGPISFMIGSPDTELERNLDERQHLRRVDYTYAIAATHVTLKEFRKFDEQWDEAAKLATLGDTPVVEINWFQGARYCNWLSEKEGLEPCYQVEEDQVFIKEHWQKLNGYRYPTEPELEYATRAGSTTCRYYGETDELLAKYAVYRGTSAGFARRVGLRKPNDWGLFDAHGNAFVWCQEQYEKLPEIPADEKVANGLIEVESAKGRVIRGGSAGDPSSYVKSAYRMSQPPHTRALYIGMRLARTMIPAGKSE